jgi:hypothetical protein
LWVTRSNVQERVARGRRGTKDRLVPQLFEHQRHYGQYGSQGVGGYTHTYCLCYASLSDT